MTNIHYLCYVVNEKMLIFVILGAMHKTKGVFLVFYDKFVSLCKQKGVSPTRASLEIGLSKTAPIRWRESGSTPQGNSLAAIADYFNISISELMDEELEKPPRAWQVKNVVEAAFWDGDEELTADDKEALWADVEDYIKFRTMQRKKSKK